MPGHYGTSMGGVEKSPRRRKREAARRRSEEAGWSARNGPVVVVKADTGGADSPPKAGGGPRWRDDATGRWHDHRYPGAIEWLSCTRCGARDFVGDEVVEVCPACGGEVLGVGWLCCVVPTWEVE